MCVCRECGCGAGDSGCINCGACRACTDKGDWGPQFGDEDDLEDFGGIRELGKKIGLKKRQESKKKKNKSKEKKEGKGGMGLSLLFGGLLCRNNISFGRKMHLLTWHVVLYQ